MNDDAKLTAEQVRAAGLGEWRQILSRLKARFRTRDFASGLALVDAIGAAAEAAGHHPDIALTYTDVIVTLWTHEVHGITGRDVELAREISRLAAAAGVVADVANLTQVDLGLDTGRAEHLGPFYAALLGSELDRGEPVDPSGQVPTVWWQDPQEHDAELALPAQAFEQRWHLDVWVPHDDAARRLDTVIAAGGRLISDAGAPSYWVVEDADGNRSCICTPAGR